MPRTSSGREFRAVLRFCLLAKVELTVGKGSGRCIPCMGHDDIVERGISAPEARETDLDNHGGIGVVDF